MMKHSSLLKQFDNLLEDTADVAAIIVRERLRPVDGPRSVFAPPTFAGSGQDKKSDYHIDEIGPRPNDPEGAARAGLIANRCTVDTVPSQANRLEPRLIRYSGTHIPKVTISGSRVGRPLDLLEVGHRIGDAVLRLTAGNAFAQFEGVLRAFVDGNAGPLASLAPTSLLFGHWDSRGETKSKARRLLRSEIVAYNVARVHKRSQYRSSIDPEVSEDLGQLLADAKEAASKNPASKNAASQLGMTDVPAPLTPGGVIAFGHIERTSIVALSGLRALVAFGNSGSGGKSSRSPEVTIDAERSLALRRYLFALSVASLAGLHGWDLREGCILVRNGHTSPGDLPKNVEPLSVVRVGYDGTETAFSIPTDVDAYLAAAAAAFFEDGLPKIEPLRFDTNAARSAIDEQSGGKPTKERKLATGNGTRGKPRSQRG